MADPEGGRAPSAEERDYSDMLPCMYASVAETGGAGEESESVFCAVTVRMTVSSSISSSVYLVIY